jgi:hypothetical protein
MAKRLPSSLYDIKFPQLWRSSHQLMANGWRLISKRSIKSRHFTGGPSLHTGATCSKCRKRLTLLWDLDLKDPLFPDEVREGFAPASRLPFYICWQCVAASYRVTANDGIKCFKDLVETLEEDETPFQDSPRELPRRAIGFEAIPSTILGLLLLEGNIGLDAMDKPARQAINDYYETTITSTWDLPFSQLGGQPLIYQGHRSAVCPNPKCPASRLEHPYGEYETRFLMKEMAVVHHDHEPELAKHCFQLLYYVCGICFSMRAEYRCS